MAKSIVLRTGKHYIAAWIMALLCTLVVMCAGWFEIIDITYEDLVSASKEASKALDAYDNAVADSDARAFFDSQPVEFCIYFQLIQKLKTHFMKN